jgi:Regulator of ribonuclease activity B
MSDTRFYLYFPGRRDADAVAERLRARGLDVTVREGADDVSWLALARGDVADEELDELEEVMQELAAEHGGEYDGYERAVRRR